MAVQVAPAAYQVIAAALEIDPDTPLDLIFHLKHAPEIHVAAAPRTLEFEEEAAESLATIGIKADILQESDSRITSVFSHPEVPGFSARVPARGFELIAGSPSIEKIELDQRYHIHLDRTLPAVGAQQAHQYGIMGSGVVVAIIDSGVDGTHPDLNGRIDGINSRNFSSEGAPNDTTDFNGHGTHVAGIIGGTGQQSGGNYEGIAPDVMFMVLKVFNASGEGSMSSVAAAAQWAIQRGAHIINFSGGYNPWQPPYSMISPPWVWASARSFDELSFNGAMTMGIPAVISAGNSGRLSPNASTIGRPAISREVITVGSLTHNQAISSFSSRGPVHRSMQIGIGDVRTLSGGLQIDTDHTKPDLVVPGGEVNAPTQDPTGCRYREGLVSCRSNIVNTELARCELKSNPSYTRASGTSMSAPVVTGLLALALQYLNRKSFDLGPQKAFVLKNIIRRSATDLNLPSEEQGAGLITWPEIRRMLDQVISGHIPLDQLGIP
jgi:subtilisin family serine protease